MAYDPMAAFNQAMGNYAASLKYKSEVERQAPLDALKMQQAQLQLGQEKQNIADLGARRQAAAQSYASPLERTQALTDLAVSQGRPDVAQQYQTAQTGMISLRGKIDQQHYDQLSRAAGIVRYYGVDGAKKYYASQNPDGQLTPEQNQMLNSVNVTPQGQVVYKDEKSGATIIGVPNPSGKMDLVTMKPATASTTAPQTQKLMNPTDNQEHVYGYNPQTQKYDIDYGVTRPPASASDIPQEGIDRMVAAVANGQEATANIPKRGKTFASVESGVLEQYPKFNFTMNNANSKYRSDSNILRSAGLVNAAMPRVYALFQKAKALENTFGASALDEPLNKLKKAFGSTKITDFESLRNALLVEVNTALSGSSVPSDFRIKYEMENLKSGDTLGQQIVSIGNLIDALNARKDASTMNAYPLEVVRGEKTLDQWRKEEEAKSKAAIASYKGTASTPSGEPTGRKVNGPNGQVGWLQPDGSILDANGKIIYKP